MTFRTLDDAKDLAGKTALVRVDFNVPMEGGRVTDDTRLRAALPTIQRLRDAGAKVALLAHFDRPKGKVVPEMSLKPVVAPLEALLGAPLRFADDCVGEAAKAAVADLDAGGVVLLENVRFHAGEEKNDPAFAAQLAEVGDLLVRQRLALLGHPPLRVRMPRPLEEQAAVRVARDHRRAGIAAGADALAGVKQQASLRLAGFDGVAAVALFSKHRADFRLEKVVLTCHRGMSDQK